VTKSENVIASGETFRNVFILESREWWPVAQPEYDPARDLVLTYDFGLRLDVEQIGGTALYLDCLCEQSMMHGNNFPMYKFFHDWHLDANGSDIFRHRDVDFGFSLRIEIWNDFTFYVRSRLCLEQLRAISFASLVVGSGQGLVEEVLRDMNLEFKALSKGPLPSRPAYFFPIHRWMDESLRARRMRHMLRDLVVAVQGTLLSWYDQLTERVFPKKRVFIQEYHPTRRLLRVLQHQPEVQVVQGHFSSSSGVSKFLRDRPIPVYGGLERYRVPAEKLIDAFRQKRVARLVLLTGVDVTDAVNRVIERRITSALSNQMRTLDCVANYLAKHPIRLEVLIANVGQVAMLVDSFAKSRGIPSYMIINGLLSSEYLDEGKHASVINAYSFSIRDNYFRGMKNVVCLGDPRMDDYALVAARTIDRLVPTITIGASGFSNIDLNSYLAVEFEFLFSVLTAIRNLMNQGRKLHVVLKVRSNGYLEQYRQFVDEYFPQLIVRMEDDVPMRAVLDQTDLYVSIYSQTLFEASCLGIPVVYHKTDRQILTTPFDGKSEIVTTHDVETLQQAILDFLAGSKRFDAFLKKSVMEKYIGPLDGGNLERNLALVNELLDRSAQWSKK